MRCRLPGGSILLAGLLAICSEIHAGATATARVSVNVVPRTSFAVADQVVLSISQDGRNNSAVNDNANDSAIVLSSANAGKPATIKAAPYKNRIYDITISSSSTLAGESRKIKLDKLKVVDQPAVHNKSDEYDLVIEGVIMPEDKYKGPFSGTAEINLNYN